MLGIGKSFGTFGTGKYSFGYIPDPPEPEETECTDEYVEGSCECCDHFEQCKQVWKGGRGMTYNGAIYEVKKLANDSFMPVIFKPSLNKIAETLEMERPKELTLSEVETYANEHNYVLWTDEMSGKALALIKADRGRPKGEWIFTDGQHVCSKCNLYNGIESDFCPNCGADMRRDKE